MKKALWLLVLAIIVSPSLILAQESHGFKSGDWEITLNGSGTSDEDMDDTQFNIEGSLAMFFTKELEIGIRQGIGFWDRNDDDDWNGSTRLFADFNFDLDRLRPFVGLNFGYLYGDGVNDSWIAGPEGGIKFFLVPSSFVFASMEYNFTFEDADDLNDSFDDGRVVYGLGLGIRF